MAVGFAFGNNLQVLPTFPLIFSNEILLGLAAILGGDFVHAEQFINIFQPLKPHGNIIYTMKVIDVIDKANGTLYAIHCKYKFFTNNTPSVAL